MDDDGESVKVELDTPPAGFSKGTNDHTVISITDDDAPQVTVSFDSATYTVAEGGSETVRVKLSQDPEQAVTIPITKADQNGATNSDYSGVPENLTFNSGDTEKTFTFMAIQDTDNDDGENEKLTFRTLPANISEGTIKETVVSVTDDDLPGSLTVSFEQSSFTVAEGSSETVKVKLDTDPERSVTILLTKTPQDGASNSDYPGVPSDVTFASGKTSKDITLTATDDAIDDDGELVKVGFGTPPTGVSAGSINETVVSITDDDAPAVAVSFEQATYTVAESDDSSTTEVQENQVTIKVKLSADPERTVTIPNTKANKDGASNSDYSGVPNDVTFNSGDTEKTFSFTATDDQDDNGESVKLVFGILPTGVNPGANDETTVSITDNNLTTKPPTGVIVAFGGSAYAVSEGGSVEVTVTLNNDPGQTVTIPITKTNQDGASAADCSGVPDDATFNSWETEKSFTFSAAQDSVQESGESVKMTFDTMPAGVTVGPSDQATPAITEGIAVNFGTALTVKLNGAATYEINEPITAVGMNGAKEHDCTGVPPLLTFTFGQSSKTFTVMVYDDDVDDDGEAAEQGFGTLPNEWSPPVPAPPPSP